MCCFESAEPAGLDAESGQEGLLHPLLSRSTTCRTVDLVTGRVCIKAVATSTRKRFGKRLCMSCAGAESQNAAAAKQVAAQGKAGFTTLVPCCRLP